MKNLRLLALAFVLGAPGAPGAPGALASQEVQPDIQATVKALSDAAAARGLPIQPLVQKAMEGSAKGVPAGRVEAAMRLVLAQLDTAAAALRAGGMAAPDTDVVAAGGFAVNAGLRGRDIAELTRTGATPSEMGVGLRVAGTLAAMGVPPAETVDLVGGSLRAHRPPADLLGLTSGVQNEMARGATPAQAAKGLARAAAARGAKGPPPGRGKPDQPPGQAKP